MSPNINNNTDNTIPPSQQHQSSENEAEAAIYNGRKVSNIPVDNALNNVNTGEVDTQYLLDMIEKMGTLEHKSIKHFSVKRITSFFGNVFSTIKRKFEKEEPKKDLPCLVSNLMAMAKRFNGKDSEKLFDFSKGCCFGIASNFVLYQKLGMPKEYHKLLLLLSTDQNSGWKFYGKKYTDIGLAIEKAQNEYKKNPQTKNSDTLTLLKLRPFAESLLLFQHPETTSMHETVPRQNTSAVANMLEGDMSNSEILPGSRLYALALTEDGLTQFVTNLGQSIKEGEAGRIFHLSTGCHILSLKVNADGYELFDQNIKGFSKSFLKGSEKELSCLLNRNLHRTSDGYGCPYRPVFQITEYNLTADKSKEKDFCLPEMIKKITNEEMLDSDTKNEDGMTAIHLAARNGSVEDLKRLHENHTVDTHLLNNEELTALHLASAFGHTKAVEFLLDHHYNVNEEGGSSSGATPLIFAIGNKHCKTAQLILSRHQDTAVIPDRYGQTPLIHACLYNDIPIITQLLKLEAVDVNQTRRTELTPLCVASSAGSTEAVKLLLEQKNIKLDVTYKGKTPLQLAQEAGHTEIVALLEASILSENNDKE